MNETELIYTILFLVFAVFLVGLGLINSNKPNFETICETQQNDFLLENGFTCEEWEAYQQLPNNVIVRDCQDSPDTYQTSCRDIGEYYDENKNKVVIEWCNNVIEHRCLEYTNQQVRASMENRAKARLKVNQSKQDLLALCEKYPDEILSKKEVRQFETVTVNYTQEEIDRCNSWDMITNQCPRCDQTIETGISNHQSTPLISEGEFVVTWWVVGYDYKVCNNTNELPPRIETFTCQNLTEALK